MADNFNTIPFGLRPDAPCPIDNRITVADSAARDAIADGVRFDGLFTYVEDEQVTYQLQGGITNDDWVEIGAQGPQGEQGPQGDQGPAGDRGPQGLPGPDGPEGPQGPIGMTGPAGADGMPGTDGADGAQGAQGIYDVEIFIVTDTSARPATPTGGSYNSDTDTVTPPTNWFAAVPAHDADQFVFTSRARINPETFVSGGTPVWGNPFEAGAQGPTGPAGERGPQGDTGATGSAGADGRTVLSGTVDPNGNVSGNIGDFYINTTTSTIFGPKALIGDMVWPTTGTSLIGATGATGADGQRGETGADGMDGARGNIYHTTETQYAHGTGVDLSSLTNVQNGDFILITTGDELGDILQISNYDSDAQTGDLTDVANIRGPQGATGDTGAAGMDGDDGVDGNSVRSGSGAPNGTVSGNVGDFYIDTDADTIYGPKTDAGDMVWPTTGTSLIGSQGPTGQTGATGDRGNDGADGRTIYNDVGAPSDNLGEQGDVYIDTNNNTYYIRTATGWPTEGVSLVGPQGATGNTGAAGSDGMDGVDGRYNLEIFIRSATAPTTPTGGTITNGLVETAPTGWSTSIAGTTGSDQLYISQFFYNPGSPDDTPTWSQPFEAGAQGPTGPRGADGPAGADGNTVRNGTGAPADSLGNEGDFYIDTDTETIYGPKGETTWPTEGTSLIGSAGANGMDGADGTQISIEGGANLASVNLTGGTGIDISAAGNFTFDATEIADRSISHQKISSTNPGSFAINNAGTLGFMSALTDNQFILGDTDATNGVTVVNFRDYVGVNVPADALFTDTNNYVTGGSVSGTTLTLTRQGLSDVTVTGLPMGGGSALTLNTLDPDDTNPIITSVADRRAEVVNGELFIRAAGYKVDVDVDTFIPLNYNDRNSDGVQLVSDGSFMRVYEQSGTGDDITRRILCEFLLEGSDFYSSALTAAGLALPDGQTRFTYGDLVNSNDRIEFIDETVSSIRVVEAYRGASGTSNDTLGVSFNKTDTGLVTATVDASGKVDNSQVLTNVPANAVFTDTQADWDESDTTSPAYIRNKINATQTNNVTNVHGNFSVTGTSHFTGAITTESTIDVGPGNSPHLQLNGGSITIADDATESIMLTKEGDYLAVDGDIVGGTLFENPDDSTATLNASANRTVEAGDTTIELRVSSLTPFPNGTRIRIRNTADTADFRGTVTGNDTIDVIDIAIDSDVALPLILGMNAQVDILTSHNIDFIRAGDSTSFDVDEGALTITATGGGGGLSTVSSDTTLNGNGSIGNPLTVVGVTDQGSTTQRIQTWTGTLEEYNLITTKDDNTLYNITNDFEQTQVAYKNLDSIAFDSGATEFNVHGATVPFTITGEAGSIFSLSFDMVEPSGWIGVGDLTASSGVIPSDGTYEGSFTFRSSTMDVNRVARLVATNQNDADNSVNTGLFRQIVGHSTGTGGDGDLRAFFELSITGTTITSSTEIIGGDAPYTVELFDEDPSSTPTPTALQTATVTTAATPQSPQTHQFTDIDASTLSAGEHTYYLRITDSESGSDDVLISSDSVDVATTTSVYYGEDLFVLSGDDTFDVTLSINAVATGLNMNYADSFSLTAEGTTVTPFSSNSFDGNLHFRIDNKNFSSAGSFIVNRIDVSPNVEIQSIPYSIGSDRRCSGTYITQSFVSLSHRANLMTPGGVSSDFTVTSEAYSDESLTTMLSSIDLTISANSEDYTVSVFNHDTALFTTGEEYYFVFSYPDVGGTTRRVTAFPYIKS